MSPFKEDFITPLEDSGCQDITGIGDHKSKILGVGTVSWNVRDVFGRSGTIETHSYYVPGIAIRLFSPQSYFQEHDAGSAHLDKDKVTLHLPKGGDLDFPYQFGSNLPMMLLNDPQFADFASSERSTAGLTKADVPELSCALNCVGEEGNQNITNPAKELLLWHWRLGHAGFNWIQSLADKIKGPNGQPVGPARLELKHKTVPNISPPYPLCGACKLGKMKRKSPNKPKLQSPTQDNEMRIRAGDLSPGDCVSVDQYISAVRGRLPHTTGREPDKDKYNGGTIFVDHASGYVYLRHQVSLRTGESLRAKNGFEQFADRYNVKLKKFRADNHPFRSAEFQEDLELKHQTADFSAVGAHHQNGVSERAIQQITEWARTMMLHSLIHWPESADPALWPFAMEHAVYLWNNMPRKDTGLSPLEVFTQTSDMSANPLQQARVWGCPVFVLDPKLQDGKKLPKWKARSRQGMYLGISASHSSTAGRILNPRTGYVSPQYHVVYDELFATVSSSLLGDDDYFDPQTWDTLVSFGHDNTLQDEDVRTAEDGSILVPFQDWFDSWLSPDELTSPPSASEGEGDEFRKGLPFEASEGRAPTQAPVEDTPPLPASEGGRHHTRSGRRVKQPSRFADVAMTQKVRQSTINSAKLQSLNWNKALNMLRSADSKAVMSLMESYKDPDLDTMEDWHPLALLAKANDEDNPTWEEAMNGPFAEGFHEACKKELDTLESMGVWEVVKREKWMNVLPSTWAFRIKRFPDGLMKKLKARFCARGDKQIEGVDYFDTYAPVVNWTTIRILLILTAILELKSVQVDYTAAFVHAPIGDLDVYVETPQGFNQPGKVYKLKKSLYGLKQSPRNFYQHLRSKLESIGFECQTEVDPCLFISEHVICITFVDDTLIVSPQQKYIDKTIADLRKAEMLLEVESDMAGFLGVLIEPNKDDNTVTLSQEGLAKRIVQALGLEHAGYTRKTPADEALGADKDGEPAKGTYSYPSVIGMMWYLYGHSRPDIGFAVSQCARFAHSPKRSHEEALEKIGLYLKGTMGKGLILTPDKEHLNLDVYVDADFCGLYGKENRDDPASVKSRTGYVICLANCPIIWASKLQKEVTLSTMMSEYYALCTAMKEVIPLQELLKTFKHGVGLPSDFHTTFKTTVWEDNNGALTLANLDPGQNTPRSKFYDIKKHWFRSHLKPKRIEVKKIDTKDQKADLFTKPLNTVLFERLRQLLCGW